MKMKAVSLIVSILLLAMLAIPVMAAPATKIEGVTLTGAVAMIPDPDSAHQVDHNIVHNKGITTGIITVNIPNQENLVGTYNSTWTGTTWWTDFPNPDPEGENVVRGNVVLNVTDGTNTGTFEGIFHTKSIGMPPVTPFLSYLDTRMVLRGTGDFLGQTLKLSNDGTGFVGSITIPK